MGDKKAETLGFRAKSVRLEKGLSQQDMASGLGMSLRAWQVLERDEGTPSGETLLQFQKLGINPGWVLFGLGPKYIRYWRNSDADAELFMHIAAMVQSLHAEAGIPTPRRGLAKTTRAIFEQVVAELDEHTSPDEIDDLVEMQKTKLRNQLRRSVEQPGNGKRSAS